MQDRGDRTLKRVRQTDYAIFKDGDAVCRQAFVGLPGNHVQKQAKKA